MANKFIADVHLGKLARLLRLLGFDTVYENSYLRNDLLKISREESRIVFSRNVALVKEIDIIVLVINHEDALLQLKQVVDDCGLKDQIHPFSRCMVCNGILEVVSKEEILTQLEKNTAKYFNEFWQCKQCSRIYWKGSHYQKMLELIGKIRNE